MPRREPSTIAAAQAVFDALAHPSRRQILLIVQLRGGSMTAGQIADRFRFAWPTVTRHLRVLEKACLLRVRKAGRSRIYRVDARAMTPIQEWLAWFEVPAPKARRARASGRGKPPSWAALPFGEMRNTKPPRE